MTFNLFFIKLLDYKLKKRVKNDIAFFYLTGIYYILLLKLYNSILIIILFFYICPLI